MAKFLYQDSIRPVGLVCIVGNDGSASKYKGLHTHLPFFIPGAIKRDDELHKLNHEFKYV